MSAPAHSPGPWERKGWFIRDANGVEESAAKLITDFGTAMKDAITAAIKADNDIDNAKAVEFAAIIDGVTAQYATSAGKLGDAIASTPPTA